MKFDKIGTNVWKCGRYYIIYNNIESYKKYYCQFDIDGLFCAILFSKSIGSVYDNDLLDIENGIKDSWLDAIVTCRNHSEKLKKELFELPTKDY
jgi:hypothetical protein